MKGKKAAKKISDRYIVQLANELYGKNTIQADACRHILAAAYFTTKLGAAIAMIGGYLVEILGSFKTMIQFKGFSSGWKMDIRNNDIGIEIGKKNKNASFHELLEQTRMIIREGRYYGVSGRLKRDEESI